MTIDEKLDLILARLDALEGPKELKPYEKPALTVDNIAIVFDGKTVNSDGSVWDLTPVFAPDGGSMKAKVQLRYGYISPKKTPVLWELAKKLYPDDLYQEWNAAWEKNPMRTYIAPPPATADKNETNFVKFNFLWGAITFGP